MTKPHVIAYYQDGHVQVAYCRECSAEGDKLLEDCPQKIENSLDEMILPDRNELLKKGMVPKQ